MQNFVFTIKLKLMLAFGTWVTLMFVLTLVGIVGLWRLDANAASLYRSSLTSLIAVASMGCAVAIYCGLHLYHVVCGGLHRMGRKFEEITTTLDLSKRSSSPRMDEFGRAAVAFDTLMRRVAETVSVVRLTTDSVTTSTREIAAGNLDLSARTEEQAASLEETAASMTQLTETVKQNADNARQANALATSATDMADAGNDSVQAMVGTIGQISSSSSKISEITGVIEGIAFQTNILALNAAVEAARAGEQGRGFAVVASEVRSLAQRSATAAKEIKELISSSVTTIQDGAKQAAEVSATMGQVKQAIKQVSDIVGEIAAASEEQSRGIEQVNQAVGQMDEVTQQNAALVEQAAAAAQSLEEQATRLKEAVSAFKVADTGQSAARLVVPQDKTRVHAPRISSRRQAVAAKPRVALATVARRPTATATDTANADWETF
ncbi:chemotaxis protein [Paraburkholderia lacunae]|uniref:Chemotaxis protein n=1 Tax=Paraburkholderia lacunae TaxID=2211104 RepID=A0A370N3F4_9BURK|nr:methyl-accepting chemotaxis protein [Paraburkholderia lacunae]RDK00121.1 chemotaxis protein [Paraburkholderia lacunae]